MSIFRAIIIIVVLAAAVLGATRWQATRQSRRSTETSADQFHGKLIIFHAGSLSVPLREISTIFARQHPGIVVEAEAAGSRECARKIADLQRECDVLVSADYTVISDLLMPTHADFNIRFATNQMAIAYTDKSTRGREITAENWHRILLADGVTFGRSDPNSDPCGYRTLQVFQLAERYYQVPNLARQLAKNEKYIRPKETDLLALLEAGEIDYLFIYRSVACQHQLKMVDLPDAVNLRSPAFADQYKTASVQVTGKRPGEMMTMVGEPMVYSVTVPKHAPNRAAAEAWVAVLLSAEGQSVMERNGQPGVKPALADGVENLPESLRPYVNQ